MRHKIRKKYQRHRRKARMKEGKDLKRGTLNIKVYKISFQLKKTF